MNKKCINHPQRRPDFVTGAYSDGVQIDGFLFISGQASIDFTTSDFILGSVEEETKRTLRNIQAIVETSGGTLDDVVKVNAYLSDIGNFNRFNQAYSEFFTNGVKPARTTIGCHLAEGIKVEIDCIVKLPVQ